MHHPPGNPTPQPQLNLFDAIAILVGIVVGAGIYESTPWVAQNVESPGWLAAVWVFGGLIALVGALCYAELTTAYPEPGGDYVFLTRAFGRRMGFIFSWAQLWIVRPGSIGAMAYVFARYAQQLMPLEGAYAPVIYAAGSITVLSGLNMLGVREGKWTQNILTTAKVVGLLAIAAVAAFYSAGPPETPAPAVPAEPDFRMAIIFVLFTYGGWNDMSYVAAEVRNPRQNLVRALLLGTTGVTLIYLLLNLAFLHVLGFEGLRSSSAVAADTLRLALGPGAGRAISVLVCISCLGAMNGMLFTGARIYYATGADHALFGKLNHWNSRLGTPVRALLVQAVLTLAVVIGFGLDSNGFHRMVNFTTPIFWLFFLLVGISLVVLRFKEPDRPRPYRALGYPLTPILFCASCVFMLQASCHYAWEHASPEGAWAAGLFATGIVLSLTEKARG